jgi:hypothetical protein
LPYTSIAAHHPASINRRNATRSANRNGHRPPAIAKWIWFKRIGPPRRQRELTTTIIEEEHPILRPRLTHRQVHELSTTPRVERMRHPHKSLITEPIERSRR